MATVPAEQVDQDVYRPTPDIIANAHVKDRAALTRTAELDLEGFWAERLSLSLAFLARSLRICSGFLSSLLARFPLVFLWVGIGAGSCCSPPIAIRLANRPPA